MFVALVIQHEDAHVLDYTIARGLHSFTHFCSLSHRQHEFREKKLLNINCVF